MNQNKKNNNIEYIDLWKDSSFNGNELWLNDFINNPSILKKKPEGKFYPDNFFKEIIIKKIN